MRPITPSSRARSVLEWIAYVEFVDRIGLDVESWQGDVLLEFWLGEAFRLGLSPDRLARTYSSVA